MSAIVQEAGSVVVLPDGRMNSENAARYLGLKPKTLAMLRCAGKGPPYTKRGRIFYFQADLDEWLQAGRVTTFTGPDGRTSHCR